MPTPVPSRAPDVEEENAILREYQTAIASGDPQVVFNVHRAYNSENGHQRLQALAQGRPVGGFSTNIPAEVFGQLLTQYDAYRRDPQSVRVFADQIAQQRGLAGDAAQAVRGQIMRNAGVMTQADREELERLIAADPGAQLDEGNLLGAAAAAGKQLASGFAGGVNTLLNLGLAAGAAPFREEGFRGTFSQLQERVEDRLAPQTAGTASQIARGTGETLPFLVPGAAVGRGASVATRVGVSAAERQLASRGSTQLAQSLRQAAPVLERAAGGAGAAAGQSVLRIPETQRQLLEANPDMTPEEALFEAVQDAAIEVGVTGLFSAFGAGGVEDVLSGQIGRDVARGFVRSAGRRGLIAAGAELPEELTQTFLSNTRTVLGEKPNASLGEAMAEALTDERFRQSYAVSAGTAAAVGASVGAASQIPAGAETTPAEQGAVDAPVSETAPEPDAVLEREADASAPALSEVVSPPEPAEDAAADAVEGTSPAVAQLDRLPRPTGVSEGVWQERMDQARELVAAAPEAAQATVTPTQTGLLLDFGEGGRTAVLLASPQEMNALARQNQTAAWESFQAAMRAKGRSPGSRPAFNKAYRQARNDAALILDPQSSAIPLDVNSIVYLSTDGFSVDSVREELSHQAFVSRFSDAELNEIRDVANQLGLPIGQGLSAAELRVDAGFQEALVQELYRPLLAQRLEAEPEQQSRLRRIFAPISRFFRRLFGSPSLADRFAKLEPDVAQRFRGALEAVESGEALTRPAQDTLPTPAGPVEDRAKAQQRADKAEDRRQREIQQQANRERDQELREQRQELSQERIDRQKAEESLRRQKQTNREQAEQLAQEGRLGRLNLALQKIQDQEDARTAKLLEQADADLVKAQNLKIDEDTQRDILAIRQRIEMLADLIANETDPANRRKLKVEAQKLRASIVGIRQQGRVKKAANKVAGSKRVRESTPLFSTRLRDITSLRGSNPLAEFVLSRVRTAEVEEFVSADYLRARARLELEILGRDAVLKKLENAQKQRPDLTIEDQFLAEETKELISEELLLRSQRGRARSTGALERIAEIIARSASQKGRSLAALGENKRSMPFTQMTEALERVVQPTASELRRMPADPAKRQARLDKIATRNLERFTRTLRRLGIDPDAISPEQIGSPFFSTNLALAAESAKLSRRDKAALLAAHFSRASLFGLASPFRIAQAGLFGLLPELVGQNALAAANAISLGALGRKLGFPGAEVLKADAALLGGFFRGILGIGHTLFSGNQYILSQARGGGNASVTEQLGEGRFTDVELLIPGSSKRARVARFLLDLPLRALGAGDQPMQGALLGFLEHAVPRNVARRLGKTGAEAEAFVAQNSVPGRRDEEVQDAIESELLDLSAARPFSGRDVSRVPKAMEDMMRDASPVAKVLLRQALPILRGQVRGAEQAGRLAPLTSLAFLARDYRQARDPDATVAERRRATAQLAKTLIAHAIPAVLAGMLDEEELDRLSEGELGSINAKYLPLTGTLIQAYGEFGEALANGDAEQYEQATTNIAKTVAQDFLPMRRLLGETLSWSESDSEDFLAATPLGRAALQAQKAAGRDEVTAKSVLYDLATVLAPLRDSLMLFDDEYVQSLDWPEDREMPTQLPRGEAGLVAAIGLRQAEGSVPQVTFKVPRRGGEPALKGDRARRWQQRAQDLFDLQVRNLGREPTAAQRAAFRRRASDQAKREFEIR